MKDLRSFNRFPYEDLLPGCGGLVQAQRRFPQNGPKLQNPWLAVPDHSRAGIAKFACCFWRLDHRSPLAELVRLGKAPDDLCFRPSTPHPAQASDELVPVSNRSTLRRPLKSQPERSHDPETIPRVHHADPF